MAWGHRVKKLTKKERETCRTLGWGCGGGCGKHADYLSNYSYASVHGHASHAKRPLCADHARQFAMRYVLPWPVRGGKVRIRFEPRAKAA
jgi:hypothetical protein